MDWLAIIPVSAVVSAVVALIFRWFDHEKPVLLLRRVFREEGKAPEGYVRGAFELVNVGNAAAYDVAMYGHLCDPATLVSQTRDSTQWSHRVSRLQPGDAIDVSIAWHPPDFKVAGVLLSYSRIPGRTYWYRSTYLKLTSTPSNLGFKPGDLGTDRLPILPSRAAAEEASPRARRARDTELQGARRWRVGLLLSKRRKPGK